MEQSSAVPRVPESDASAAQNIASNDRATPRVRRIQRTALALLLLSGVINYIDRATLSIANPLIRQDLGLSVGEMGLLLSAFLWAYAFAQLPAGALVDRFGARIMLTVSLATWSVAQAFGGVGQGRFTGAPPLRSGLQTALIGGLAAGAAFLSARLISH